ncbi:sugar ABC transporter permease [Actinomadura rudentiformis]|uniref:Carbohydrate ABC transporter permease n=1 Tax=Actinomadura rudentiformis TaxID=359158 RepID=A0A6H9Z6V5_9ACTN|nr:carbohydrate ABC transporter permease [Actinomadura rudentiformis]KAB2349565.1 carbohydrate ABC transporter permease [Actinomadura rudentiformis]
MSTRDGKKLREGKKRSVVASVGLHAALLTASAISLIPLAWLALTSFKPKGAWISSDVRFFDQPTLDNYRYVLTETSFPRWLLNSVLVAGMTMVIGVLIAASTGYAISRFRFAGLRTILWLLLVTQMFPVAVLIVPLYNLLGRLGLINQYPGLVVAYLTVAVPFSAWMMKGYFDTIPTEIDQAGQIDGLTPFGAFFRLILPLAKPGLAVAAFYSFITAWGEVAYATAFMTGDDHYTLAPGLQQFVSQTRAEWGWLTAAAVLITIPAGAVFLAVQRHLVTGLTAGASKS